MVSRFAVVFAAAALCALTGCEDKNAPQTAPKSGKSAVEPSGDPLQMAKDSVVSATNEQITKIEAFVEKLKGSASKVAADAKPEFDKAMESIETGMTNLKAKMEEMKKAGAMQWQTIGAEVTDIASKLYNDAKAAVEKWVK